MIALASAEPIEPPAPVNKTVLPEAVLFAASLVSKMSPSEKRSYRYAEARSTQG
jgi:hypothetical protein